MRIVFAFLVSLTFVFSGCSTEATSESPVANGKIIARSGKPCHIGSGACRVDGIWVMEANTIWCNAYPDMPQEEIVGNHVDDDCDGTTDEAPTEPLGETPPDNASTPLVRVQLDDTSSAHWCDPGMTVEQWVWDNTGFTGSDTEHVGSPYLMVPADVSGIALNGSVISSTVNCRYGSTRYEIVRSPRILSAAIGAPASRIGAHVFVGDVEVPAFICWDSLGPRDPNFKRIQFHASTTMTPTGCAPGTDV